MICEGNNAVEAGGLRIGLVYESLPVGKERAIPGHELAKGLDLPDLRKLTLLIERERRAGFPICAAQGSDGPGYYRPEGPGELEAYIKRLSGRAANYRRTIERLNNTLAEWCGQVVLFDDCVD